ncbi:Uncharacterised protein [Acinetobacter baumannii]|nr:Uncharacterised protein [Acinetobacter baumannii]
MVVLEEYQAVLGIEVVGDDRGEGEEQDDHRQEIAAPIADLAGQGILHQHDALAFLRSGQQDDGGGSGTDQQGIDEHAGHLHVALGRRVRRIGRGRGGGVGRRAHACFVGEQAALEAVEDRRADAAGGGLVPAEGTLHHHRQDARQFAEVEQDDAHRQQQVGHRHEGYRQFGEARDGTQAAEDDQRGEDHHGDAADPGRHAEGALHGTGDGIGLHRVEDETEGDDQEDREQDAHPARAQALLHVVGRAATELALVVANLEQLGQGRLDEAGRHPHQGDRPHPEHRAGTAERDRYRHAGDVAGTDPRRQRGAERLERGDSRVVRLAAALEHAEGMTEVAELDQPQAHGEVQAATDQQPDEDLAPDKAVEQVDDLSGEFLHG